MSCEIILYSVLLSILFYSLSVYVSGSVLPFLGYVFLSPLPYPPSAAILPSLFPTIDIPSYPIPSNYPPVPPDPYPTQPLSCALYFIYSPYPVRFGSVRFVASVCLTRIFTIRATHEYGYNILAIRCYK